MTQQKGVKKTRRLRVGIDQMRAAISTGGNEPEDRHRVWQDKSHMDKTQADHHRDWEAIKEAAGVEHVRELSENMFLDILRPMIGQYHESRLEKYRSAVKWEQIAGLPEEEQWYKTARFKARFSGMIKEAEQKHREGKSAQARERGAKESGDPDDPDDGQRGALQLDKVIQVARRFKELHMAMYTRGIAVAYAGAFRHEELAEFTLGDLKKEGDGKFYIRVVGGKGRGQFVTEWVWIEGIDATMEDLLQEKERRGSGLMFEGWREKDAVGVVQWCARQYNWDPNRRWDWHCIRHGRAVDWRLAGIPLEERMRRGRWHDKRTEEWYSRPR